MDAERLVERFVRYARVNTTSDPALAGKKAPTSSGQVVLARMLKEELEGMGVAMTYCEKTGILYGGLPSNLEGKSVDSIGFTPHLDTAPDWTTDTHPQIVEYQEQITLANGVTVAIDPMYRGDRIVVTDGTSLLGADDKAAIAAVMGVVQHLTENPTIPHGPIRLAFLPDEEIGLLGAKALTQDMLPCDYAYCLDACKIGEYVVDTWEAAQAVVVVKGTTAHPMSAKGVMVNSITRLTDGVLAHLPKDERCEVTEGREGFIHVQSISGTVLETRCTLNLRYFDRDMLDKKCRWLTELVESVPGASITITHTYPNPCDRIRKDHPHVMSNLLEAMKRAGVSPIPFNMRGGYDGCVLPVPTANFFTGAHNFHSNTEYLPVGSLCKAAEVTLHLIAIAAEGAKSAVH